MSTLTIRASESESEDIENLKKFLGVGHGTKALLLFAKKLPQLQKEYDQLYSEHIKLKQDYYELIDLLEKKSNLESKIQNIVRE
jgi:hypothetical protein